MPSRAIAKAQKLKAYNEACQEKRRLELELFRKYPVLDAIAVHDYQVAIRKAHEEAERLKPKERKAKPEDPQLKWTD